MDNQTYTDQPKFLSGYEGIDNSIPEDFDIDPNETEEEKKTRYEKTLKLKKMADEFAQLKLMVLEVMASETKLTTKTAEASELMASYLMKHEHIYTTRDDERAEMWIYKDGIYVPQARTYIYEFCRKVLGQAYSMNITKKVIDKVEADTFIEQDEFFDVGYDDLVAVSNGILNVKTRELKTFSPEYRFFSKLPVGYDPEAKCDKIERFLESVLSKESDIKTIYEIFGFFLYEDYFIETAIMCYGSGRNGKGKTISLMKNLIGIDNCAEISIQDLETDGFAMGELFKKKANLCGDLGKNSLKNSANFKKLIGRDMISASRKYKNRVKFINTAKMVFAANELPITYDTSDAFFSRWVIIDFPFKFLSKEEIKDYADKDKGLIRERDPDIIKDISTPEELSGLLNKSLDGLDRILENKDFTNNKGINATKRMWLRRSDSCSAFIVDCIIEDQDAYVSKTEFKTQYKNYCGKLKLSMSNDKRISNILMTQAGAIDERLSSGDRPHIWRGINVDYNKLKNINPSTMSNFPPQPLVNKSPRGCKRKQGSLDGCVKNDSGNISVTPEELSKSILKWVKTDGLEDVDDLINMINSAIDDDTIDVEKVLNQMKKEGLLFEPSPGKVKVA